MVEAFKVGSWGKLDRSLLRMLIYPRDFPLGMGKTLGTRLEKPIKCGGERGGGGRGEVVEVVEWGFFSLSQHCLRSSLPVSIIKQGKKMYVVRIKMH